METATWKELNELSTRAPDGVVDLLKLARGVDPRFWFEAKPWQTNLCFAGMKEDGCCVNCGGPYQILCERFHGIVVGKQEEPRLWYPVDGPSYADHIDDKDAYWACNLVQLLFKVEQE